MASTLAPYLRELESLKLIMNQILSDRKLTLNFIVGIAAFFTFPFVICCFVVSITPNAGFNAVLTSLLNICYVFGSFFVLANSKTPIAIGFLLGASTGMFLLNLSTAIYWGQLSKCTTFKQNFNQYTCSQPDAYGAVCAFAVFLFLDQLVFTILLYLWRGTLIDEVPDDYESLPNPTVTNPSHVREVGIAMNKFTETKSSSGNQFLGNKYAPEPYGLQKVKPVSTSVEL